MLLSALVAVGLLVWSLVANLVVGETLYVVRNLVLTALLLLLARRAGISWAGLGLDRASLGAGLRWGQLAVLAVVVVVAAGAALGDQVGAIGALLSDQRANLGPAELAYHSLLRIPVGTALFEEVAFRAVLLALLLQATGSWWWAVGGSSVVFGLWHVAPTIVSLRVNEVVPASGQGLAAIAGAVALTTVAGVLFAVLRLVSGSLLAPVLAHWATNAIGLLAAAVTQRTG